MAEAYHRADVFPDEDVVVGSPFADALDAFKELDDVTPSPGSRAVGEERAWGRRLAKRSVVEGQYDEKSFVVKQNGREGFIDFEQRSREAVDRQPSSSPRWPPTPAAPSSFTVDRDGGGLRPLLGSSPTGRRA